MPDMPVPRAAGVIFACASSPKRSRGLAPVARHRLVYAAVADLIPGEIHALALEALPPSR